LRTSKRHRSLPHDGSGFFFFSFFVAPKKKKKGKKKQEQKLKEKKNKVVQRRLLLFLLFLGVAASLLQRSKRRNSSATQENAQEKNLSLSLSPSIDAKKLPSNTTQCECRHGKQTAPFGFFLFFNFWRSRSPTFI
jgi:hypothetical protein